MITDQQVKLLRFNMTKYSNQEISAAKSGMSQRSARKYLKTNSLPSELKKDRTWETRKNPFSSVWKEIEQMLLLSPKLTAKRILVYLIGKYPKQFYMSNLRALQRHIQIWRSASGADKDVIFPQDIKPGRQSQSDYTNMNELNITIKGEQFSHILFHFMLPYSRWEDAMVCYSESFNSLSAGYEQAVWKLGRQAPEHRTDNLSAAIKPLKNKKEFTQRWTEFIKHYNITSSTNNPGKGNENGSVEKSHDLLKRAIDQELMIRGSRDFSSQSEYEEFVQSIVDGRNKERIERLKEEIDLLKEIPDCKYNAPALTLARVSSASTVKIQGGIYSVPSRLIGYQLKAFIYPAYIELYYGKKLLQTMPKLLVGQGYSINYRHIINQLIRKPGAFEDYKYKDSLFPRVVFRKAYDYYKKLSPNNGHKIYLKVLQLAAFYGENVVAGLLEQGQGSGHFPSFAEIEKNLAVTRKDYPSVNVISPNLTLYDRLVQTICPGGNV